MLTRPVTVAVKPVQVLLEVCIQDMYGSGLVPVKQNAAVVSPQDMALMQYPPYCIPVNLPDESQAITLPALSYKQYRGLKRLLPYAVRLNVVQLLTPVL